MFKRCLLLGRKVMTNLDSMLKNRDTTLPTKVCLVKAMVFPVIMYGCESWTIKNAECQRIDAFELWCWGKLLRVPRTARRSYQSILKEISPEYSLEGLMLKLKLLYTDHLMWRTDSFEKTLMLGKIEARRKGWQRMRWLDGITDSMDMGSGELGVGDGLGFLACCSPWGQKELDMTKRMIWTSSKRRSRAECYKVKSIKEFWGGKQWWKWGNIFLFFFLLLHSLYWNCAWLMQCLDK